MDALPVNYIPSKEEILVVVGDSETDEHGVFQDKEVMATIEVTASEIYSRDDIFQMSLTVKNLSGIMSTDKEVVTLNGVTGQLYEVTMFIQEDQPVANMKFILVNPLDDMQMRIMYKPIEETEDKEPKNGVWQ